MRAPRQSDSVNRKSAWIPFAGVDRRTACLRATLLIACFLGLIASLATWLNARSFPVSPIAPWFPILPAPGDRLFLAAMLLALVAAPWFYRPSVAAFVVLSLFAFCEDQNRGQPWFYLYWVMLLMTLFPAPTSLAACRMAMAAAYLWSGIQKCNAGYRGVPSWFVAPATHWHLPAAAITLLQWSVAAAPILEIGIGVGLWLPRSRRPAMAIVLILHVMAVLFLGPLGHNYNWVVWPWNLAMIALVWALFTTDSFWLARPAELLSRSKGSARHPGRSRSAKSGSVAKALLAAVPGPNFQQAFAALFRWKPALVVVGLFALLPILSYSGRWDSYFSFALYSGNTASANYFVTQTFADRLPAGLRGYVHPFRPDFDPLHQGPFVFNIDAWAYEEMHVPPVPEVRNYQSIFRALRIYANEPADLRMIIGPRAGPVIFQEGEIQELLLPKR